MGRDGRVATGEEMAAWREEGRRAAESLIKLRRRQEASDPVIAALLRDAELWRAQGAYWSAYNLLTDEAVAQRRAELGESCRPAGTARTRKDG